MKFTHRELFSCQCETPEHDLVIKYNEEDKEVFVSIYLSEYYGFWKRLWYGIKYVLGKQSDFGYGAFDCVLLKPEDADRLQVIVDHLKSRRFIK